MNQEEQKRLLNENWKKYLIAADEAKKEGKPIGTFSSWQFENKLISFDIPLTKAEYLGQGI